jgi:hydroxymethylbilane synthase
MLENVLPALSFPHEYIRLPEAQLNDALLTGELDCAARPLHRLPANTVEGIVNAALIDRKTDANRLFAHPDDDAPNLLQLKKDARVYAFHPVLRAQLLEFRPDFQFMDEKIDGAQAIALNPREFCPPAGFGAIALQACADDLPMRRLLQTVHRSDWSALTNVERKLLRLLGGDPQLPFGAFCERDPMGHYHLWAAYAKTEGEPVVRIRLSSSTTFELAEQAFANIQ